jgi:transcriptional regulator with XRE-family HTH domain
MAAKQHPLRVFREKSGYSLSDFARQTKVAKSVISKIETYGRQPTLVTAAKIIIATNGHLDFCDFLPPEFKTGDHRQRKLARA